MEHTSIIYAAIAILFFVLAAKFDIHMFQLSSYRYSRFFRWLIPGNILTGKRLMALAMIAQTFIGGYLSLGILAFCVISAWVHYSREKFKTPLVYTMRVKRLFATNFLLFASIMAASLLCAGKWATLIIGITLLLSDIVMLLANLVNTPIEKAINRYYYNDAKRIIESHKELIIIGVTGSFGKTSTKNYLASVLAEKYNVLVTPGNFNTLLGVIRTIREQLRPYHQVFIVEMGAKQPNDIKEICDLVHPTIGIVTAVGEMHLETFKSVKNIQKTKFELIDSLPVNGLGIINYDSEHICGYKGISEKCRIVKYAIKNNGEYRATDVFYSGNGVSFTLSTNGERFESRLLGTGNLLNILATTVVADYLDVPVQKQKKAIARLQPVEHRLSMNRANGITILDDAYNSNPNGARMALEVLKNFNLSKENKRIIVTPGFVEMGARQYDANKGLGSVIASCADYAIIVNATNREAISKGLSEGGMNSEKIYFAENLTEARKHLGSILQAGDVILYENDLPDNFK